MIKYIEKFLGGVH